jgi:hypothetical protein
MDNAKLKIAFNKIGIHSLECRWQEQVQQYVLEYVQKLSE